MSSTHDVLQSVLDLGESEFFTADASVLSRRESRLLEMDFSGVAVNAPRLIATTRQEKLPLIMACSCSGDRDWEVGLKDNCMLVASNLLDGSVRVANALLTEKELKSRGGRIRRPKGPKPPGLAEVASQLTEVDARARLDLKWSSGTWSLGILYFDWPSNTVVVRLDDGAPPQSAVAVPPVHPAFNPDAKEGMTPEEEFLPAYFPTAESPAPPEYGISFRADFRLRDGRQSLFVRGAFALPRINFYSLEQEIVHEFRDGVQRTVRAIVPVTLALLKLDGVSPWQFDWAVPVYDQGSGADVVRGFFAADALAMVDSALGPGSYVCYMIADGRIFGPGQFQV